MGGSLNGTAALLISYNLHLTLPSESQSLLLIPSRRNLTSFKTLLVGFQASNCSNNSVHSPESWVRTMVSSRSPRSDQGRKYGFTLVGNSKGRTRRGMPGHSVVSRAWRTPRLGYVSKTSRTQVVGNQEYVLINSTIVINPRVTLTTIQTSGQWSRKLTN